MKLNRKSLIQMCVERGWSLYRLAIEARVDPSHLYRILSGKGEPEWIPSLRLLRPWDVHLWISYTMKNLPTQITAS